MAPFTKPDLNVADRNGRTGVREKLVDLENLGRIVAEARGAGRTVAHCHGVFDLLHMGHVRHLEEARAHGDLLVVTVTADAFVNKGPGRPVFTGELRAEMLAALAYVDHVAVNHAPTAEPALEAVRPDVYVKGPDYADPSSDVTGKIRDEANLVESWGGRIVYTDGITFSSSELINRHFNPFDGEARAFLDGLRDRGGRDAIFALMDRAAELDVLVIGETIIDEYRYATPMGKTPKENMIAALYSSAETFAGGVVATANHLAGVVKNVEVLTILGDHDSHEDLVREKLRPGVRLSAVIKEGAPTTRKVRYVEPATVRKLFEVYHMDDAPLQGAEKTKLLTTIEEKAAAADLVVVNDFGHGMLGDEAIATLSRSARFLAVNAQTNTGNFGFNPITKYPRADYICIDKREAHLAAHEKHGDLEAILRTKILPQLDCPRVMVTMGPEGALGLNGGAQTVRAPAVTDKVVDTVGAGDAFLAITSPLACVGGALDEIAFVGNIAGALKVGIIGHRSSVDKVSILKAVTALLK